MNKLSILYFSASLIIFSLGILVYVKNPKQALNRIFSLLCLSIFAWQFFYALMLNSVGIKALYFAKIGHFAVPFIPVILLHYVIQLLKLKRLKFFYIIAYLIASISATLTIATNLCFNKMKLHSWGLYPDGNILMLIDFIICSFLGPLGIFLLINGYYKAKRRAVNLQYLNKIKYSLFAMTIFLFAIMDYLPKLYKFPIDIIPIGNIAIIIFASINSYAILKHNLLDLNIVIRKGLIYSSLVTFITISYFVIVFLAESLFRGFIGYKSIPLTLAMVTVFILLFQPLKNKIQFLCRQILF